MTRISYIHSFRLIVFIVITHLFTASAVFAHGTQDKNLISPARLAKTSHYKVIDLRSSQEYRNSHIPGAFSLPLQELSQDQLQKRAISADDWLVLYSRSESGAKKGKMLLDILGYEKIKILAGGFTHWQEDGQQTATGPDQHVKESSSAPSAPQALIITPASYDFGVISQAGGTVSTRFDLKNMSSQPVRVTEISTSCGCTSAELDFREIPPGEERVLTVFFDPNFHKEPEGKFSRTVFLQLSNGAEAQVKIEVEIAK